MEADFVEAEKEDTIASLAKATAGRMPPGSRGWVILHAIATAEPRSYEALVSAWKAAIYTSDSHHDGKVSG